MLRAATARAIRYASSSFSAPRPFRRGTFSLCGPPELQGYQAVAVEPLRGLTENLAHTYYESGSACLDFFFHIVSNTDKARVKELAEKAWKEDPLTTLKLMFQLRGVRGNGKSDKLRFYDAACWLYDRHPKTLAANIGKVAPVGYFKDLLELVQRILEGEEGTETRMQSKEAWKKISERHRRYRSCGQRTKNTKTKESKAVTVSRDKRVAADIEKGKALKEKASKLRNEKKLLLATRVMDKLSKDGNFVSVYSGVAEVFANALLKDLEAVEKNGTKARLSLAAKWCPSLDSSYDKQTLLCEAIACKVFPKSSEPEYAELSQEHYAYRVRDRLRKQILVPLRKALQLPEVYMTAQKWDELPYNRVASVAMKNYTNVFMEHDKERFKKYLEDVKAGKAKIAAGALLPHQILMDAVQDEEDMEEEEENQNKANAERAELQWKAMVAEMREKGSLQSAVSICDVSGSMEGTPINVSIALGLLTAELSDEPWKGRLITFSNEPAFHEIKGETLAEKYRFTANMPWDMNTDFQKVFDRILEQAQKHQVPPEKMVKRLFVYSDMEFDSARKCGPQYYVHPSVGGYNAHPNWWGSPDPATLPAAGWETDYMAIKRKFKEAGYENPPEIVFWNLRDSHSVPVTKDEAGVALVSGFSKNLLKMFLNNNGVIDPMGILKAAISGEVYEDMVVVD